MQIYSILPSFYRLTIPGNVGLEADQILSDAQDQILGGSISAQEGLTSAQDKINTLLGY